MFKCFIVFAAISILVMGCGKYSESNNKDKMVKNNMSFEQDHYMEKNATSEDVDKSVDLLKDEMAEKLNRINEDSSMEEVLSVLGMPDYEIGSGNPHFCYEFGDKVVDVRFAPKTEIKINDLEYYDMFLGDITEEETKVMSLINENIKPGMTLDDVIGLIGKYDERGIDNDNKNYYYWNQSDYAIIVNEGVDGISLRGIGRKSFRLYWFLDEGNAWRQIYND